jgi:hypothetical protein
MSMAVFDITRKAAYHAKVTVSQKTWTVSHQKIEKKTGKESEIFRSVPL